MAFILGKTGLFRPKTPPLSQKPVVMYDGGSRKRERNESFVLLVFYLCQHEN